MTTKAIVKTLIEHQETVRRLLEGVIDDVRQWRTLDKEVTAISVRLSAIEASVKSVNMETKECRKGIQEKLNGISALCSEGRVAGVEARAKDRDEWRKEMKTLEDRIQRLKRDSAVVASKYGITAAILSFVAAEAIRWLIRYAH